jgi:hypothetical protein
MYDNLLKATYWSYLENYKPKICVKIDNVKQVIGIRYGNDTVYCAVIYKIIKNKNNPEGAYNYVITLNDEKNVTIYLVEPMPLEIGSKHFNLMTLIPKNHKVLAAGEMSLMADITYFNFESGSVMIDVEQHSGFKRKDWVVLVTEMIEDIVTNPNYTDIKLIPKIPLTVEGLKKLKKCSTVDVRGFRNTKQCYKKFHLGKFSTK